MNPLGMPFQADVRNCGGRCQIECMVRHHREKITNAKPAIRINPPRAHIKNISPSRRDSGNMLYLYSIVNAIRACTIGVMKSPEFAQVRATYRAVSTLKKGRIDSNLPKTFALIRALSVNRKQNPYQVSEHLQNIQSLQRRMERIYKGNMYDRKKNHFDCVAYPSLFFRRQDELSDNFSNTSTSRPLTARKEPMGSTVKQASELYKTEALMLSPRASPGKRVFFIETPRGSNRQRPSSAVVQRRSESIEFGDSRLNRTLQVGLKKKLIEEIVRNRIYRQKELDALFEKELKLNQVLGAEEMKRVWDEVLNEINAT